jgi:quercetin dioxygenase-like cupin family protein
MKQLFANSIKAKKLSTPELESIKTELSLFDSGYSSIESINLTELRPSLAAIFLYGLQKAENRLEVNKFVQWISNPEMPEDWSETFETLIERVYGDIQLTRIGSLIEKINLQKSLTEVEVAEELVSNIHDEKLSGLYENKVDELNIDFSVALLPFKLEVLDPRIVTVKPGKANEMHRHAHETVFIFLKGHGKVIVDNYENEVSPGDFALIPRWSIHQSVNLGHEDLVFLAVADFGLTGKSFIGNYNKTARLKR